MKSQEWKWGLIIGAINIVWLFASWGLGWHGGGIASFQIAIVLGFFLSFVGYVFAFRSLLRAEPETTFPEGLASGAVIAALAALLTAGGWALYLGSFNPGMSAHLVSEVRAYYTSAGVAPEQVEEIAAGAQDTFRLSAFTINGGVGSFVLGILYSAIILGWIKWQARR